MFYYEAKKLDVYVNGVYVAPTNAYYQSNTNQQMMFKNITNATVASTYMPLWVNESGANLLYNRQLFFTMSASDFIDIKIAPVVSVGINIRPATTPSQFFDPSNIVQNIANLLGVPQNKIRYVNIVRAKPTSSASGRRRRRRRDTSAADEITISLTIYDDPVQLLNDTDSIALMNSQQVELGASIVNQFATGQLQENALTLFNVSLLSMTARQALANPNASDVVIGKIEKLQVVQAADGCSAQVPCRVQPILLVIDEYVSYRKNLFFFYDIENTIT